MNFAIEIDFLKLSLFKSLAHDTIYNTKKFTQHQNKMIFFSFKQTTTTPNS